MINITNEDVLEIPIAFNGKETGESLYFDLDDVDLLLRYQELIDKDQKNREWLRNKILILEKQQDTGSKDFLSKKEKEVINLSKEFFKKEEEVYNIFLGENGVQKLLCGRKLGWSTMAKIDEVIEKDILPNLDLTFTGLKERLIKKYKINEDENVI